MTRFTRTSKLFLWTSACLFAVTGSGLVACSDDEQQIITQVQESQSELSAPSQSQRELSASESFLLDLAARVASALPADPHQKTLSRLQESVVRGYLDLGRHEDAALLAQKIGDWRQALAEAQIGLHLAELGDQNGAHNALNRAQIALDRVKKSETQSWRLDRVQSVMAQTQFQLGREAQASALAASLGDTEWSVLDRLRLKKLPEADYAPTLKELDAVFTTANLDQARTTLQSFVVLRERFFANEAWRAELERRISQSYAKLPLDVRLDLMFKMAEQSMAHQANAEALKIIQNAEEIAAVGNWLPEARIPFDARIASLRYRAGDRQAGGERIQQAFDDYARSRDRIVDIFRGQALRPLAAAYAAMGAEDQALRVYHLALEEAQVNPNSRPRAEDLTALCLSILSAKVVVNDDLKAQLEAAYGRLGQPW